MSIRQHRLLAVCALLPLVGWVELGWRDNHAFQNLLLLYAVGVSASLGRSCNRFLAALTIPSLAVALGLAGLGASCFRAANKEVWWQLDAIEVVVEVGMATMFGTVLGLWSAENFPGNAPERPAAADSEQPS